MKLTNKSRYHYLCTRTFGSDLLCLIPIQTNFSCPIMCSKNAFIMGDNYDFMDSVRKFWLNAYVHLIANIFSHSKLPLIHLINKSNIWWTTTSGLSWPWRSHFLADVLCTKYPVSQPVDGSIFVNRQIVFNANDFLQVRIYPIRKRRSSSLLGRNISQKRKTSTSYVFIINQRFCFLELSLTNLWELMM